MFFHHEPVELILFLVIIGADSLKNTESVVDDFTANGERNLVLVHKFPIIHDGRCHKFLLSIPFRCAECAGLWLVYEKHPVLSTGASLSQ